jgi:hypothetical protein
MSSITYGGLNLKSVSPLADDLGVKDLLPAYLDPNLQPQDLITGVCFASGGAGYDPLTSKAAVRSHMYLSLILH